MSQKDIYRVIFAGVLQSGFALGAEPASDEIDVSGLVRINTKITDGAVLQTLPNLIVNAKINDWVMSGALQVQNLEPQEGFGGDHDARLFFATGTYTGLQDQGTTIKTGLLAPFELTQFPLSHGFSAVSADDNYKLYGGIVGVKVAQNVYQGDDMSVVVNGGVGTKPDGLERFGPVADHVVFSGFDVMRQFGEHTSVEGGYQVISFSDDNPLGTDHFVYGRATIDGDEMDYSFYAESVIDERYSVSASAMKSLAPKTEWEVAAGVSENNGVLHKTLETGFYQKIDSSTHVTGGVGYDFESDDPTIRIGLKHGF